MDLTRPVAPDPYASLPAVASFALTSDSLVEGAAMPASATADGGSTSPHLSWTGFPPETRSFVVSCFDPDAPTPAGFWHWTVVDLPVTTTSLDEGLGESDLMLDGAAFHVRNDGGGYDYTGAAPPEGDRVHRYVFAVHALDIETLERDSDASPTAVAFTALFHTIARATLTVTYER
ncbi:YbhB/YbcL family Raf kinase inhibitor-like protein [Sanguibacter sp. A247]|uniref:YbhB/YbcL family Raf kinase inhibitor-like protein n=1 Tax=unclassified Sanguibacter TaxID=2645534 RepID=UPI003FD88E71